MNLLYLILGMGIVTYLPRLLPMVLLKNLALPPYLQSFMKLIPYAALGALIVPGVFTSAPPDQFISTLIGFCLAVALAFYEWNVILIIAGSILGVLLTNLVFS